MSGNIPKTHESGQVVLITLLILSIATTIALSLIGRTTTDIRITSDIEESARAFSAAEAGIEEVLKSGTSMESAQTLSPGLTYQATIANIGGATGVYAFSRKTTKNTTETLWLVNHNDDGTLNETPTYTASTLDLCWSSETTTPALVVSIFYKESTDGTYKVARGAYDPQGRSDNKFETGFGAGTNCGQDGYYKKTIDFAALGISPAADALLIMRVRPVYSDTNLAIDSGVNVIPLQGKTVESSGSTTTGVTRKITVFQQYRTPASIFDAGIVTQQGSFVHE